MALPISVTVGLDIVSSLRRAGRTGVAEQACREALLQHPHDPDLRHLLGMLHCEAGRLHDALELIRQAAQAKPGNARFQHNLGTVLGRLGRDKEAAHAFTHAVRLRPDYAEAHSNLAAALNRLRRFADAEKAARRVIELRPKSGSGHVYLGSALSSLGRRDEALEAFRSAVALEPNLPGNWKALLAALEQAGQLSEAIESYQQAISLFPADLGLQSARLYLLHQHSDLSPEKIFNAHMEWGRNFSDSAAGKIPSQDDDRSPTRKIRLCYISADFRDHPTARFIEPMLKAHDRDQFQVYCYSDVGKPDEVTKRCREAVDAWRNICGHSDEQVGALIRQDGINILIDITGHMAGNRMALFAKKPAPIQVALPMYPGTTGLSALDYFFSDGWVDPPGKTEHLYVEKLVRLSPIGRCYQPDEKSPDTIPLPADVNGFVTFGALNRLSKVTDAMLASWAQIIAAVPNSRLKVLVEGPGGKKTSAAILARFERQGFGPETVEFLGRQKRWQYLESLAACDICLDTFPYNGCTTTCDSLWMGTPVVTLVGETHVSRVGFSFLSQVGLAKLAAQTPVQYVETAVVLANDRQRLREIRTGLRERMWQSPLTNANQVTRAYEQALRGIWTTWCKA
jgi:predicted O-linked N-acetylglucosamine transferase (SPINDLY family)